MWDQIVERVKKIVGTNIYEAYFKHMKPLKEEDKEFVIAFPNETIVELIQSGNYLKHLISSVQDVVGLPIKVSIVADASLFDDMDNRKTQTVLPFHSSEQSNISENIIQTTPLYPLNTFENFVQGPSNETTFAAAQSIARHPGLHYNPFFVYGDTGLGKTHILHAIGHYITENTNKTVCYFEPQNFMDSYVKAIKNGKIQQFREKIFSYDIILIDDVQFFSGKEGTQNELFFIFNKFHNDGKQVVLTSDQYPGEIKNIDDRLKSRFSMGVTTEIRPPEYEMRIAIIEKKAQLFSVSISDEVVHYLAKNIRTNVRQIEGALKTLKISANMVSEDVINKAFAMKILKNLIKEKNQIDIQTIIQTVATYLKVKPTQIIGKKRTNQIARARQIAMYLSRELTSHTFEEIGEHFGGRNHSTVISSIEKIKKLMLENKNILKIVKKLKDELLKMAE